MEEGVQRWEQPAVAISRCQGHKDRQTDTDTGCGVGEEFTLPVPVAGVV